MVATTLKAAVAARIKNNVVRGLGAACGGRADLLRAIPSEDDHVFSKTPGETTKTPGDTLAPRARLAFKPYNWLFVATFIPAVKRSSLPCRESDPQAGEHSTVSLS